jgi:hypothetical protein
MTEPRTAVKDWQEDILQTARNSQEALVDALKTWAATVQSVAPTLPAVNLPLAGKLPSPYEVVTSAYDFAEQMLASQRKFAEEVLKITAPVTGPAHSTAAAE